MTNLIIRLNVYLAFIVRTYIALVLIRSAVLKFRDLDYFSGVVYSYQLIPKRLVKTFTYLLPVIEMTLGGMLFLGWYTGLIGGMSACLFLFFILAVSINLIRGRNDLDCGCSGPRKIHTIGIGLILRDIGYLLLSLYLSFVGGGLLSFDSQFALLNRLKNEEVVLEILIPITLSSIGLIILYNLFLKFRRMIILINREEN
jgi:uncharacterized membrane protein YphA (DoxX/SURF4 family)